MVGEAFGVADGALSIFSVSLYPNMWIDIQNDLIKVQNPYLLEDIKLFNWSERPLLLMMVLLASKYRDIYLVLICRVSSNHEVHLWKVSNARDAEFVWLFDHRQGTCKSMAGGGKPTNQSNFERHLLAVHNWVTRWTTGRSRDCCSEYRKTGQSVGCIRGASLEEQVLGRELCEHCGSLTSAHMLPGLQLVPASCWSSWVVEDTETRLCLVGRHLQSSCMVDGC